MKKILLLSILIFNFGSAQIDRNFGDGAEPVPSASSMTSYVNAPVSLSTGVPDISLPLFSLPTSNNNLEIPVALSYHVYNTGLNKVASEVGLGWLLTRGGTISRMINTEVDEIYDDSSKSTYIKNAFDDIYYYNIPGSSGKFKFIRNTTDNTFTVSNISGTNVKIEYTREANNATLVLSSFTIKDQKGFKYIFNDYSKSLFGVGFYYKSSFYLTRILDESDIEVATFTYDKNSKYKNGTSILLYQNCKVNEISTAFGKVKFTNFYNASLENSGTNDPYSIGDVSLFDTSNRLISKHKFTYSQFNIPIDNVNQNKRILLRVEKLDKNSAVIESRDFSYDEQGSTTGTYSPISSYFGFECNSGIPLGKSPRTYTLGTLKKMTLPGGGYTTYDFEANEYYEDRTNLQINNTVFSYPDLQYISPVEISFDTNQTMLYTLQITSSTLLTMGLLTDQIYDDQYSIHQPEHVITFKLKQGTTVINPNSCGQYPVNTGTYTVEITGFGNGSIGYSMIKSVPAPYKNAVPLNAGVRIANIKHFDFNNVLQKVTNYEYNSFDNTNNSSGGRYISENCGGSDDFQIINDVILYRNVKETYGDTTNNIGYGKYYFKMPEDFPAAGSLKPYYNITSSGLQYKQEDFNKLNVMTGSRETEYVMEDIAGAPEYTTCTGYNSKSAWIKSAKITSKTFFDNATSLTSVSETSYSPYNFGTSNIKEISPEGIITEKNIKYASDLSNAKLINANILDVPLETETKVNSILTGKAETKYDNAGNLYPSSVTTYDLNSQTAVTKVTISSYDSKGNAREIVSPNSIPTAIIYGYNQTLPIAKIVGATYAQIASLSVVTAAIKASNNDAADPTKETALITALENLRKDTAMKDYSVTTHTYDPLIGVTSTTSPNGQREVYKYDTAGRLQRVEDINGKLLKENGYNYKH